MLVRAMERLRPSRRWMQFGERANVAMRSEWWEMLIVVYCRALAKAEINEGQREAIQPVRMPAME